MIAFNGLRTDTEALVLSIYRSTHQIFLKATNKTSIGVTQWQLQGKVFWRCRYNKCGIGYQSLAYWRRHRLQLQETDGTWKVSWFHHWVHSGARVYAGKVQEIKPLEIDQRNWDVERYQGIIYSPSCALPYGSPRLVEEAQIQRRHAW